MTKQKPQAANSNNAAFQTPVSFLQALDTLAQPVDNVQPNKADPVATMRGKFVANADGQIKLIQAAAPKGKWFQKQPDGNYVVGFRNANQRLTLNASSSSRWQTQKPRSSFCRLRCKVQRPVSLMLLWLLRSAKRPRRSNSLTATFNGPLARFSLAG
jgi:hypothetical protein